MNAGELNLAWADALIAALVAAGVTHAVVAPGARSAPLALAALRRPELTCEVLSDERVAGYFALGLGQALRRPALAICTSGTAAANLLPAAMEANLAGVPLLLLTADRPPEAHGWGANQTVDQARLYGSHVRACHAVALPDASLLAGGYLRALAAQLVEEATQPLPGPVHANLPFREPLLPVQPLPALPPLPAPLAVVPAAVEPATADVEALARDLGGRRGVIVCGGGHYAPGFAAALTALAAKLKAPVLADPLSNLRFGSHDLGVVCAGQAGFLRGAPPSLRPEWVLRFGAFPVSRVLESWLASLGDAEHMLVAPPGRWPDPLWQAGRVLRSEPLALVRALATKVAATEDGVWLAQFVAAEGHAAAAAAEACRGEVLFEGSVAATLLDALPAGAGCFVGNSLAIRAVDAFGGKAAKALTLYGNRGASGIDGNFATAAGIAAATGAPTAALIGDQAALHDMGGAAALKGRNVVAVVMNNGGGGIFDHLPLAAVGGELFERGWIAASGLSLAGLAAAHGLHHARAATRGELAAALAAALRQGGAWLLESAVDRHTSKGCFDAFQTLARL